MNLQSKFSLLLAGILVLSLQTAVAQKNKANRPSPPAQVTETIGGVEVTIDYSQPAKKGRDIFGSLVPYGQVWRTGANEASWIKLSKDAKINGKTLKAGTYALFTIPGKDDWTIIFNEEWEGAWGAYKYNKEKDALRVTAKPKKAGSTVERFTISIADSGTVSMAWDETQVDFTIK